nr:hypothetical protein Iba_chr10aCG13140 [Ipomoea batatas]
MGRAEYDLKTEELVQKANRIFLKRVAARGKSEELGLRSELRGERDRADSAPSVKKSQEGEESSSREVRKKDRVIKSTLEWVKVVEEYMEKDKNFELKVKEALKEVNAYLWTVYDKEKEEYAEEIKKRAVRAATIFFVKVELCSSSKNEKGLLERNLKANIDLIGARICAWAVEWDL